MKKIRKVIIAMVLIVVTITNQGLANTGIVQGATIKISQTKKTVRAGQRFTLKVTGTTKKVTWSSSDKTIASVSAKGYVWAKKAGNVTITAKVASKKLQCKIKVLQCKIGNPTTFCFEADSVDGITVLWKGKNNTGKKINYYTVNFKFVNPVGDPAQDEISGNSTYSIQYVGPVAKGEELLVYREVGYFPTLYRLTITSIDLIYSDKSKETIQYNKSTTDDTIGLDDLSA